MKAINVKLPDDIFRAFRTMAIDRGISNAKLVEQLVGETRNAAGWPRINPDLSVEDQLQVLNAMKGVQEVDSRDYTLASSHSAPSPRPTRRLGTEAFGVSFGDAAATAKTSNGPTLLVESDPAESEFAELLQETRPTQIIEDRTRDTEPAPEVSENQADDDLDGLFGDMSL